MTGLSRFVALSILIIAAATGGCATPEQIGAQAQAGRPDGHGVAVAYVRMTDSDCFGGTLHVGTKIEGGYATYRILSGMRDNWRSGLAFESMEPGTYEIVSVSCETKVASPGLLGPKTIRNDFYASKRDFGINIGSVVHEKGLASFTVGPDEVVDIGSIDIVRIAKAETKQFSFAPAENQASFRIGSIPQGRLEEWRRLHPDWAKRLVTRHMTSRF